MVSGAPHGQRRQNIQAAPEGQHYREAVESNNRLQLSRGFGLKFPRLHKVQIRNVMCAP